MDKRREMRASDTDRQTVVGRLSVALDEGRLSLHEYDQRLVRTYQSVTYGDLADLFADLPTHGVVAKRHEASLSDAPDAALTLAGIRVDLPTWIRILWTIWLSAVCINLVVWILVSLSNLELIYFWPIWVIGPAGSGLAGLSIGATFVRRSRRAAKIQRGLDAARRKSAKRR
jgi:hypothetical protein